MVIHLEGSLLLAAPPRRSSPPPPSPPLMCIIFKSDPFRRRRKPARRRESFGSGSRSRIGEFIWRRVRGPRHARARACNRNSPRSRATFPVALIQANTSGSVHDTCEYAGIRTWTRKVATLYLGSTVATTRCSHDSRARCRKSWNNTQLAVRESERPPFRTVDLVCNLFLWNLSFVMCT